MNRREEQLIHTAVLVEPIFGLCLRATHNPKAALLRFGQGIEAPCHYETLFAMKNDFDRLVRGAFAAMYDLRAKQFFEAEVETI